MSEQQLWQQALPRIDQGPVLKALFKSVAEDFEVTEELGFEPGEGGEHLWLWVEKRDQNTQWLARQFAQRCGVEAAQVSYSGLKDRNALTRQWFSIQLPGKPDPDWAEWGIEGVRILRALRHNRKLRIGTHKRNRFRIRLRQLEGEELDGLEARLEALKAGVPNYYGPQRFGHGFGNLEKAQKLFAGTLKLPRPKRSLALSAARSWLFNRVLAARIEAGLFDQYLPGDLLGFPGSASMILPDRVDAEALALLGENRRLLTGPLWGRGTALVADQALAFETKVLSPCGDFCRGLEQHGLKQERRALKLLPQELTWQWRPQQAELELEFALDKGCFATAVLHELCGWLTDATGAHG